MEFKMEWIRPVVFGLLAVWVFSFMLWDFILAVIKTWERVRSDQANIFDLKLETQFFVGGCVLIGWGLHYLYRSFQEPNLAILLFGGGSFLVSVWVNRTLKNKWRSMDWEPLRRSRS